MPVNNLDGNNCSEKICIQGKKVFDACMKQVTLQQITVSVSDVNPPNPAVPLRFVSCKSTTTKGIIENLVVERLTERPKYGRVQADVVVPVEVTYIDSNNVEGVGQGTVTVPVDVVMFLPEPSIIPYAIEASVSAVSPEGKSRGVIPRLFRYVKLKFMEYRLPLARGAVATRRLRGLQTKFYIIIDILAHCIKVFVYHIICNPNYRQAVLF